LGQRGFANALKPFGPGEFFPASGGNYSTAFEVLSYIARSLFGYRLGTLPNTLAYLGCVPIVWKMSTHLVTGLNFKKRLIFAFLFLNVFLCNECLMQQATYFVEGIQAFFILLGMYFCLKGLAWENTIVSTTIQPADGFRNLVLGAFFLGISVYGKLTAIVFVGPLAVASFYSYAKATRIPFIEAVWKFLILLIVLCFPQLIQSLYLWRETGNPLFPFFNAIFQSPYYVFSNSASTPSDNGFGGANVFQKLFYPFFAISNPKITGEIGELFADHKIFLYYAVAIGVLISDIKYKLLNIREKVLAFSVFAGCLAWSFTSGVIRYAIFLEIAGSVLVLLVCARELFFFRVPFIKYTVLAFLLIQDYRIIACNLKYEYSWRPTLLSNIRLHREQFRFLTKRELDLPNSAQSELSQTDLVVNCRPPSSGYSMLTQLYSKPLLLLDDKNYSRGLTQSNSYVPEARARLLKSIQPQSHFATFLYSQDMLADCLLLLDKAGFKVEQKIQLDGFLGYPSHKPILLFGKFEKIGSLN
jgi:hypothetical protein